jgi:hypothetical protein
MFKELFVVLSAKISGFIKGIKQVLGLTEGARKQINSAASDMGKAFESAFSGDLRSNIANLSESISINRDRVVELKSKLKELQAELKKQSKGTEEFKKTEAAIRRVKKAIFDTNIDLATFNIAARDQKSALASSRLAAEDNSAAMEATSRAVNAATGALLLFGEGNETLKPVLKGVGIAMGLVNVAIVFQNLKLRENAVLARTAAVAQNTLRTTFVASTAAATAFRVALGLTVLGAVAAGLAYLATNYDKIKAALQGVNPEQRLFQKYVEEIGKGAEDAAMAEAKLVTETKYLKGIINSSNASLKTKANAYERLVELVPELSKYTLQQATSTGVLNKAIQNQINLLGLQAEAQAIFNAIVAEKQIEIQLEKNKKLFKSVTEELAEYNKLSLGQKQNLSLDQWREQQKLLNGNNSELNDSLDLYKQLEAIQTKIFALQTKTTKTATPKKVKSGELGKSFINEQEKLAVIEAKITEQRLLLSAKTEEEKAIIINATEQEILNIRKQYFIQGVTAQNANQSQSLELWSQYKLDVINAEVQGNKRLQDARDKDTDAREKADIDSQESTQEANLGLLAIREELYQKLQGINAKQYNDGNRSEKEFLQEQKQLTVDFLKEKIALLKVAGVDTLATEKQLSDALLALSKNNNNNLVEEQSDVAKRINRVFEQAFRQLGNDIANALNDSLNRAFQGTGEIAQIELDILREQQRQLEQTMKDATQSDLQMLQNRKQYLENEKKLAEATESNLSTLFRSILEGIADFLQNLGIGLVAAAVATDAFQTLLLKNPKAAAVAGAAAVVASAGVRAILAKGVKFADGGIVSGPTLGLVGEYPGASTNPEVIAPLNKLKSLIGNTGDGTAFIAETRISGRDLAIVFNRYNKDLQRG